ncbi:MAG: hypothetical protein QXX68_02315 [Candidatus Pacearchaeota archaeon]
MEIEKEGLVFIQEFFSSLNPVQQLVIKLIGIFLGITIYSIFVYYTCKIFSRKNLLDFNFMKRASQNSTELSFLGFFLYVVEYLVIVPVFVFLWFGFYSAFVFLMAKNFSVDQVLMISAALVASIRATSFFKERISQDLATIFPLTFLFFVLSGEQTIELSFFIQKFSEISSLFNNIIIYLLFIFSVEMIFRIIDAFNIFILKRE